MSWHEFKSRFGDERDVERNPGCGAIATCLALAIIGGCVVAICCWGAALTWWPSG